MGYAVTSVTSEGIKNAQTEHITFASNICYGMTGTVEEVFYKTTHDLTNVDYLELTCKSKRVGANGTLTLYFDTTSKGTATISGGNLTDETGIKNITVNCTAVTGDQIIKLGLVNSTAGQETYVAELCMYARSS